MPLTDINKQMPRLKTHGPTTTREFIRYCESSSTFSAADAVGMIYVLRAALLSFASGAKPLRLEDFGIFTPTIKLDGTLNIKFRPEKSLIRDLNDLKS